MKQVKYNWILLLGALLLGPMAQGQNEVARSYYDQLSFQKAIERYEKILERDENNGEAIFHLANSFRLNGEYTKAEKWFKKAVEQDGRPLSHMYYGQALLINGKYEAAGKVFEYFSNIAENSQDQQTARQLVQKCRDWKTNGLPSGAFQVEAVPFNSEALDFSPAYFGDQTLVFVSNRSGSKGKTGLKDPWTDGKFMDLYYVTLLDEDGIFGEPKPLKGALNGNFHEGPVVFADNGGTIFFTRNDYDRRRGYDETRNTRLKIFQGHYGEGGWINDGALPFNNSDFATAHPAMSPDGSFLIFASDRPGGYGGMDLYRVDRSGDAWGEPINLGAEINSGGNEVFPFISSEGHLYFSSDFLVGYGGLDIYRALKAGKDWSMPRNMGIPINSPRDDFGMIYNEKNEIGYFSSNRSGKDDDIYRFVPSEEQMIRGRVLVCKTEEAIEGARVLVSGEGIDDQELVTDTDGLFSMTAPQGEILTFKASGEDYIVSDPCPATQTLDPAAPEELVLYLAPIPTENGRAFVGQVINSQYGTPLSNAEVTFVSRCTGEVVTVMTDENGNYRVPAPEDCDYILQASKSNFKPNTQLLSTFGKSPNENIVTDVPLIFDGAGFAGLVPNGTIVSSGMLIELEHIYFDYDKYTIRPDAIPELEEFLAFLQNNPRVRGELRAHTDSRAPFRYNLTLSNNRAQAARTWLIQHGIDPSRITARGFGEILLRNECSDGVDCSSMQHQRNRRVEFLVKTVNGAQIESKEKAIYR